MATRKSPASAEKKTTAGKAPEKKAVAAKAAAAPAAVDSAIAKRTPSYEEIAILAEQYWQERGRPFGTPEVDWLRAEASLYAA
jgi:hypothetical protein